MMYRVKVDWFLNCLIVLVSSAHLDKECRSKGVGVFLDELIARLYPEAQAVGFYARMKAQGRISGTYGL